MSATDALSGMRLGQLRGRVAGAQEGREVPGSPGAIDPLEAQFRLDSVSAGACVTIVVCVPALIYALTDARPADRALFVSAWVVALAGAEIAFLLPWRRIIHSRWREAAFWGFHLTGVDRLALRERRCRCGRGGGCLSPSPRSGASAGLRNAQRSIRRPGKLAAVPESLRLDGNPRTRQPPPQARSAAPLSCPGRSLGHIRPGPANRQNQGSRPRRAVALKARMADGDRAPRNVSSEHPNVRP
jgi:hypothetical protein